MDDLTFLTWTPAGTASLVIVTPDGAASTIDGLDVAIISERCPVLAHSFEMGARGLMKSSIEATSYPAAISFLRYIFTGHYTWDDDFTLQEPSILIHAEICRLADIFECPELQVAAHMNIIRSTEVLCSLPTPPSDLCDGIRFIYSHLSAQRPLIETVLHYCVSCFTYHKLGENPEFRKLADEHATFHRDLSRINAERDFENTDIFKLPGPKREKIEDLGNFLYHMWSDNPNEDKQEGLHDVLRRVRSTDLAHRPKRRRSSTLLTETDDSASEVDDFVVVHRPKRRSIAEGASDTTSSERTTLVGDGLLRGGKEEQLASSCMTVRSSTPTYGNRDQNVAAPTQYSGLEGNLGLQSQHAVNNRHIPSGQKSPASCSSESDWTLVDD